MPNKPSRNAAKVKIIYNANESCNPGHYSSLTDLPHLLETPYSRSISFDDICAMDSRGPTPVLREGTPSTLQSDRCIKNSPQSSVERTASETLEEVPREIVKSRRKKSQVLETEGVDAVVSRLLYKTPADRPVSPDLELAPKLGDIDPDDVPAHHLGVCLGEIGEEGEASSEDRSDWNLLTDADVSREFPWGFDVINSFYQRAYEVESSVDTETVRKYHYLGNFPPIFRLGEQARGRGLVRPWTSKGGSLSMAHTY